MNFKNHKYQNVKTEDYSDQDQNEQQYFTDDDDHNIQQVINPVYNVNSYLDLNKNNHNNHQPAHKTHTNNKRNNSFLNIITKAIRNLINTKNDDQTKSLLDYSNSKQIKIDEIKLNKQNNQINFKLQMPFSLFKPEQIKMFQTKKCFRKKTQTNSSESESVSSEFNDHYESDYNKITRKKNKKRCLKSHHQSEQNLFDLNRKDFTEFSLQSLSSYHNKSNMNDSNRRVINWIIFFTVISVIFNPLIGPIAFCYAIKSKLLSLNDIEKSTRFKKTAKQLVIASLLVTFMFVLVPFILFMYQNEIFRINQTLNNSTNLTTTSTTTNIFTTSSSTLFTNSTRLYESNVYLTKIFKTLIATTTTTTSKPIVLRSYDKLNILIDHDLFKSLKINTDLFQRLKITNQTLILN